MLHCIVRRLLRKCCVHHLLHPSSFADVCWHCKNICCLLRKCCVHRRFHCLASSTSILPTFESLLRERRAWLSNMHSIYLPPLICSSSSHCIVRRLLRKCCVHRLFCCSASSTSTGLHSNLFRVERIAWLPDIDCIHLSLPMYASLYSTRSPAEVLCSSSIAFILLRRCMLALQEHMPSPAEVLCSSTILLLRIIHKRRFYIRICSE